MKRFAGVYVDVPFAPGISIWYKAEPAEYLDNLADAIIATLKTEQWFTSAMLRIDTPVTRLVAYRMVASRRYVVVLEISSRITDMREVVKAVAKLKYEMEEKMGVAV